VVKVKEHEITSAFSSNNGPSKVEIKLERDFYEPDEIIPLKLIIDNSKCSIGIKRYKVKLFREIRVVSCDGSQSVIKAELIKRKFNESIPENEVVEKTVQLNLLGINLQNQHLEKYLAKNPNFDKKLKDWLNIL
jgi:hypothetical protein